LWGLNIQGFEKRGQFVRMYVVSHIMYLAYVDESGSDGPLSRGGSQTFTLGCVLVDAERWPDVFDDMIDYRRYLRLQFKIPVRAEIKANYLLRNGGPLRDLHMSERARFAVYRGLMRLQAKLELNAFAIVIRKDRLEARTVQQNSRDIAWEYLIQRLERFTTIGKTQVILFHDEGEGGVARKLARKARRAGSAGSAFGTGTLKRPARLLLDDPISRKSHESYFLQLADLNAYAAFRYYYPPPPRAVHIVPQAMWDELGAARYGAVNRNSGGTPGIVVWP
jgi:hypothetical protein